MAQGIGPEVKPQYLKKKKKFLLCAAQNLICSRKEGIHSPTKGKVRGKGFGSQKEMKYEE
jgi:hypothetical protein